MIRRDPLYVSSDVWRWLRLLSKAQGIPEEGRIVTPDEIADQILRVGIERNYPQIRYHQREVDALEKKVIESLQDAAKNGAKP